MNENDNNEQFGKDQSSQNSSQNPQSNSWVFSDRNAPKGGEANASHQNGSTYSNKYSYSSYENSQKQGYNASYQDTARQDPASAQEEKYRWSYSDYEMHQQPPQAERRKSNSGVKVFVCILGAILCVGVLALAGFGGFSLIQSRSAAHSESALPQELAEEAQKHTLTLNDKPAEEKEILSDGKLTIPQRAEKVKASVVGIVNYQQATNSMFSTAEAQGSGIILSEDGYIVTNAHVVEGAIGLKVVLSDGTEYAAQLIGSDVKTDLAVVKVEATGLPAAEFGNSDQMEVGEQVIAVGNPTGLKLGGTLTVGYVSALNRKLDNSAGALNYIQTDAAINPGNSGGALANEYGQVIGINSAKISGADIEGLSFAISINEAQPVIDDLIQFGYVKGRVRMGITIFEMDEFMARLNDAPAGIIVASVEPGTPAAASGLVPGDIITSIDGNKVVTSSDIGDYLEGKKPGDVITLGVFRRTEGFPDKQLSIPIELIEAMDKPAAPDAAQKYPSN